MTTQDVLTRIEGIVSENSRLVSENAHLQAQLDAIRAAMGVTPTSPAPARKAKTRKTHTPAPKASASEPVPVKVLRDMGGTIGHLVDGMAYAVTYDRAWTWVYFQAKPSRDVLDLLGRKGMGGRYTPKRGPAGGWGFDRMIQASEFAHIIGA